MTGLQKISQVLGKVQESTVNNMKYILILKKIYENHEFDDFVKEFLRCLKHFLIEDTLQNHFADNGLEFCAMFSTSLKIDNSRPLMKAIILKVLELHVSQSRYRVCLFINQVLHQVYKNDECIDATLSENIKEAMLERMQDVKSSVQIQAIEILERLQDSNNPNDPVIKAYMQCLCDRNTQVRKTIIRCIGLNANSIPLILKRCFDIDESVRYSAYNAISKLSIQALRIEHRQYILENGLKNDNENIRIFVQKTLLSNWLSYFKGDYFQLICALKLDADERDWKQSAEIVETTLNVFFSFGVLKNFFEILPLGSDKLIKSSEIKWEQLIYWRCLTSYLRKHENATDYLEKILPELTIFCEFILRVYESRYKYATTFDILYHDQLMLELWKIAKDFDCSDEIGRRNLHKLIKDILIEAKLSYNNVLLMVKILEHLHPSIEERTNQLTVIISEIRNPLIKQQLPDFIIRQQKVEIAKYRVELNIAVYAQEQALGKKNFETARELQGKIKELESKIQCLNEEYSDFQEVRVARNDVKTLSKCLDILIATLSSPNIERLPVAIITLQKEFVQPLLISPLPEIYLKAMHFYGLVCIADKIMAQISVMFFCAPILSYKHGANDEPRILLAIACITDLLLSHGRDILEPDNQNTTSSNSSTSRTDFSETACISNVVEIFARMLDDENAEIRERSCEAIVKLMCHGVISSSVLLSRLILKWFDPATAKDVRLRQLLGCLFVEYVTEVPGSLKIVEDAFIPTLLSVVKAPGNSALANVSVESTLKFLIELSRPGRNKFNKDLDLHTNISLLLCRDICNTPNDSCTTIYLKALIMLNTPIKDEIALGKLCKFVDTMVELIKDKTVLNYVWKYKNKLESDMEQSISTIDTKTTNASRDSKLFQSMESNLHESSPKKPKQTDKKGKCSSSKNRNCNGTIDSLE